ncbi:MAG: hypothetical protein RBT73_05535 [Spirochaetia bacterium]|jgi:hypothetical protein|nr:hypothetical protein [Spirochaetia bacterium]
MNDPKEITPEALALCLEYSENPDALKEIISSIEFSYQIMGVSKFFDSDTVPRLTLEITLSRKGKEISFPYGASLNDTETYELRRTRPHYGRTQYRGKYFELGSQLHSALARDWKEFETSLLYSILSSISAEYDTSPIFKEFCADFGYDEDSRKAFSLWQRCLEHAQKLQTLFTPEEVESFPS